mmetsp:Transcript_128663/g.320914  ORF Transcript_128663/g.320914 Transcript_128663/m.320914 type:complete len:200 (+) Transcript_128663:128-727(+)
MPLQLVQGSGLKTDGIVSEVVSLVQGLDEACCIDLWIELVMVKRCDLVLKLQCIQQAEPGICLRCEDPTVHPMGPKHRLSDPRAWLQHRRTFEVGGHNLTPPCARPSCFVRLTRRACRTHLRYRHVLQDPAGDHNHLGLRRDLTDIEDDIARGYSHHRGRMVAHFLHDVRAILNVLFEERVILENTRVKFEVHLNPEGF